MENERDAGAGAASRCPARSFSGDTQKGGALRIAVGGKGGSGKTTIAATLARLLARRGRGVTALDGDPNPNLGIALGMSQEKLGELVRVPREIMEIKEEGDRRTLVLTRPVEEVAAEYGMEGPDGVRLMVMTGVDHAGAG